jgi:hypothetical protein
MKDMGRLLVAKIQIGAALVTWAVAFIGAVRGEEWFTGWLYFWAWYPLLFCLDGLLILAKEESRMWNKSGAFVRLAAWSVTVWLIFEGFNLHLQNWRYLGVEPRLWVRWPGYALAFATVMPGIFLVAENLAVRGYFSTSAQRPRELPGWQPLWLMLGAACLALPLVFPQAAFPLIWLAFIFLLDPINDLLTGDSFTRRWLNGGRQEHYCLLAAGFLCGLFWEFWNYFATSRWVYTLPALNFGKIFEMPLLGYLGFPPFALACAIMYNFLVIADERFLTAPRRQRWFWLGQGIFWAVMFWAIDNQTVLSFR